MRCAGALVFGLWPCPLAIRSTAAAGASRLWQLGDPGDLLPGDDVARWGSAQHAIPLGRGDLAAQTCCARSWGSGSWCDGARVAWPAMPACGAGWRLAGGGAEPPARGAGRRGPGEARDDATSSTATAAAVRDVHGDRAGVAAALFVVIDCKDAG